MCIYLKVNTTIENICYEYCEDVMFSIDISSTGKPIKIIAYLKYEYIPELSKILSNHGYNYRNKRSGKYYTLIHFEYLNKEVIDTNNIDLSGEV